MANSYFRSWRSGHPRRGFTLVELLVVIAIIGILVALLLPAIQAAREAARRTQCQNNLKQIGLALQNYLDTHKTFPIGSAYNYASSWLLALLPYVEQRALYDQFLFVENRGGMTRDAPAANKTLLADQVIPTYLCPSSPLEILSRDAISPRWCSANYLGIAGAPTPTLTASTTTGNKCIQGKYGYVCSNGILPPNLAIRGAEIKDGTSNTMIVGEQSDFCTDASGARVDLRNSWRWGFAMGAGSRGYPGTSNWTSTIENDCHNVTTIRYAVNFKTKTNDAGGQVEYGTNNAIQSAHPGGAFVAMADGSVRFLADSVDVAKVLCLLAARNDGLAVADF